MVAISHGTFTMGSLSTELGRVSPGDNDESPQHTVTLTHDFSISSTEVTQTEFQCVMSWNPSAHTGCADCPVDTVSWFDAVGYANQLTMNQGGTPCYSFSGPFTCYDGTQPASYTSCMNATHKGISTATVSLNGITSIYDCAGLRLPTEAEWEYAARAGTTAATYNGDLNSSDSLLCTTPVSTVLSPISWFCGNAIATHTSGGKTANAWGLYDMLGNVWEWCHDWYAPYDAGPDTDPEGPLTQPPSNPQRVDRGCGFDSKAECLRSSDRDGDITNERHSDLGLRIAKCR